LDKKDNKGPKDQRIFLEKEGRMRDRALLTIVAILCITALQIVNLLTIGADSTLHSTAIGAIVFMLTRKYYHGRGNS